MKRSASVAIMLLVLTGCGGQDTKEISETRTSPSPQAVPAMPPGQDMQMPSMDGVVMPLGHPPISPYKWQVPEGWSEVAATSMRIGNFKVADSPGAECYLTVLKGAAGGVDANINRWRRQMGQPELKPEEIAALARVDVMGRPGTFVEINGSFTGMAGQQFSNYTLMGAVAALTDQTLFVKMTGPEAVVKAEKDRFIAFCKSIAEREPAAAASGAEKTPEAAQAPENNAGVAEKSNTGEAANNGVAETNK